MPYCTEEDLLGELGAVHLARLSGDPAGVTVNSGRIALAIDNATETIDAYLRGRYALPPDPPSKLLQQIASDIAIFNLYAYESASRIMPGEISGKKSSAIDMLIRLQAGRSVLPGHSAAENAPPSIIANKAASDRMFGKEGFDGFGY